MEAIRRLPPTPTAIPSKNPPTEYVTVVSVGVHGTPTSQTTRKDDQRPKPALNNVKNSEDPSGFVTVLKIGDTPPSQQTKLMVPSVVNHINNNNDNYCVDQVLVYRLPGERLGFGLKFEGGTKAAEFVKRLFIQSCAPDSPASRVRGSWGVLTEGDEVLAIDSVKVTSMTRIDCVRCLKDSNVVIKLQVRHKLVDPTEDLIDELKPLVISAEKKRTAPPPPPVPPRKGPRKKDLIATNCTTTVVSKPTLPPKGFCDNEFDNPNKTDTRLRLDPPSAEVYLDLFSQEPDAYCLSESDDTGSSISTVVDRFGSFPTTTTSSFAGSMPSTPTAVQRRINYSLSSTNPFDVDVNADEELFERLVSLQAKENHVTLQPPVNFQDAPLSYADEDVKQVEASVLIVSGCGGSFEKTKRKRPPPPPPPRTKHLNEKHQHNLSESLDTKTSATSTLENLKLTHQKLPETNNNDYSLKDENTKLCPLPRLVDFVPKSTKSEDDCDLIEQEEKESSKVFIEQEQLRHTDAFFMGSHQLSDEIDDEPDGKWCENEDDDDGQTYAFGWSSGQPLATIGEADNEDESLQDSGMRSPDDDDDDGQRITDEIVRNVRNERSSESSEEVDNVDGSSPIGTAEDTSSDEEIFDGPNKAPEPAPRNTLKKSTNVEDSTEEHHKMDTRQPPDGHEFPDYHQEAAPPVKPTMMPRRNLPQVPQAPQVLARSKEQPKTNVKNMIAMFSHEQSQPQNATPPQQQLLNINGEKPVINVNNSQERKSFDFGSMSDLTSNAETTPRLTPTTHAHETITLHKRSQSLIDISSSTSTTPATNDRWSQILDQRRRGLSKLKGLIIPEHPDGALNTTPVVIDLPEIKTTDDNAFMPTLLQANQTNQTHIYHGRNNSTPSLNISAISSPLWSTSTSDNDDSAKYSPAFKRKTLQVYTTSAKVNTQNNSSSSSSDEEYRLPSVDAPKSLESITSPTRSDCSFDYASMGSIGSSPSTNTGPSMKTGKSEDESDNDSAVSSSQSSYISRQSPPASPNHFLDSAANRRLLKAQSVEAINRKNILASAKCRSGKDLNGSPLLIQRKFDEPENNQSQTQQVTEVINENHSSLDVEKVEVDDIEPVDALVTQNGVEHDTTHEITETKTKTKEVTLTHVVEPARSVRETKTKTVEEKTEILKPKTSKTDKSMTNLPTKLISLRNTNQKAASVTDLRKNFEKTSITPPSGGIAKLTKTKERLSTSNINQTRPSPSKRNSLPTLQVVTTPAPKTIVKLQDKKQIIEKTVKSWDDEAISVVDIKVIALRPEIPGGSIGITLAGGTDYETKDITIHKVRNGSVAHRDGRLRKGERVLSINGKSMNAITHAESMAILKEPVLEVIIVTSPPRESSSTSTTSTPLTSTSTVSRERLSTPSTPTTPVTPNPTTGNNGNNDSSVIVDKPIIVVKLIKDPLSTASGLGFSMEGGKESSQGDVPLLIKKLFTGGLADKSGMLAVGDELIEIQGTNVMEMPRIDAWSLMKKLPPGEVTLKVRR